MGGLALGNALASRYGERIRHPVRFYAGLEIVIAVSGMSLVMSLPLFEGWLTPVFRPFLDTPFFLNSLRLSIAFLMILVPTTAMGITLPMLVKALYRDNRNFGPVLGQLYGWNTLGAVLGALSGEVFLIKALGIRATGLSAVFLNFIVAFFALHISRGFSQQPVKISATGPESDKRLSTTSRRLLAAAFLTGAVLLSLEVVWFRFLLLFNRGTSLVFAAMLSIILAGIGSGGLIASRWYRHKQRAHYYLHTLSLISGILTLLSYLYFERVFYWIQFYLVHVNTLISTLALILLASSLMLPVSILSGILFTFLGRALKEEIPSETKTAGMLTLSNTTGALLGSLVSGFFLLPVLGMESSLLILAAAYGITAFIIPVMTKKDEKRLPGLSHILTGALLIFLIPFSHGHMQQAYFSINDKKLEDAKRVATRESLTETIFYYRYDVMGKPFYHRLVTNSFSMSSTHTESKRYMKLFVYLPVALNPDTRSALLISYGVGSTAKALTDTKGLTTIDIVDISKDILDMSSVVYADPDDNPLHDGRVSVHIEDGRFFLRSTDRRFDLITAEPPPPKLAGVVNLYSQEYFDLIYKRLSEGGIVSYWLPVHQLYEEDARTIIKAFCNVFDNCSLWKGAGLDWILIGTRAAVPSGSETLFSQQWLDPVVGKELKDLGVEIPAQLGALFIADSDDLRAVTEDTLPLVDNYPLRLSERMKSSKGFSPLYAAMMEESGTRERFLKSDFIERMWPEPVLKESLQYFDYQRMIKDIFLPYYRQTGSYELNDLYNVLTRTLLRTLPLWMLHTTQKELEIADVLRMEGKFTGKIESLMFISEISERNYGKAIRHMETYLSSASEEESLQAYPMYIFTLCMDAQTRKAEKVANEVAPLLGSGDEIIRYWQWMRATFGIRVNLDMQD
jgi:predicted membrane-bound spermidine synthase